jgi:hypothetical protein
LKSALSLTLIVCLAASAVPVTAQEQTKTPGSFDLGEAASSNTGGSLTSAETREADSTLEAGVEAWVKDQTPSD